MHPLRFGFKTTQMGGSYGEILAVWQEADRIGFDTGWLFDHFAGIGQAPLTAPCDEGWTLLTAVLARTERIRGGLMVTGNTHRHPALLANIAATVDQVSNGRLEFGLGTGWSEPEHAMYGWELPPVPERVRWFNEACDIIKRLWTEPEVSFDGQRYQLDRAVLEPKPIQKPYPHFVVGASGERLTIRAAARHADEWNWVGGPVDDYRRKLDALNRHLSSLGRDPASLQRSVQFRLDDYQAPLADTAAAANEFIKLGVDHIVFGLKRPFEPAHVVWLWRELVPAIRDLAGR